MLNKLPGSMQYLSCGQRYHCNLQKNESILILISLKRYFSHPENKYLTEVFLNFKEAFNLGPMSLIQGTTEISRR